MPVRDFMAIIDRRILKSKIVRAVAEFPTVTTELIEGGFTRDGLQVPSPDGSIQSLRIAFETRARSEFESLQYNAPVIVDGVTFRFLREVLPGGDESGMTFMELGE